MHVVFVSKEYPPSNISYGIGTYVYETVGLLRAKGICVSVVCATDGDSYSYEDVNGAKIYRLFDSEASYIKRGWLSNFFGYKDYVNDYRSSVVEQIEIIDAERKVDLIEGCGFRGELGLVRSRIANIPLVVRFHGWTGWIERTLKDHLIPYRRYIKKAETKELLAADAVSYVSESYRRSLSERIGGDRLQFIPNSINMIDWCGSTELVDLDVSYNDIVFVGTKSEKKGIKILIEAALLCRRSGWEGRLVVIGRSTAFYMDVVDKKFGGRLPSWYVAVEHVPRECLSEYYRSSGVCCFPSLVEPFGYTCLEAMASGAIVIGSANTGMELMIDDKESGFLVKAGDSLALSKMILKVLGLGSSKKDKIKRCAISKCESHFSIDAVGEMLVEFYREVVSKHR